MRNGSDDMNLSDQAEFNKVMGRRISIDGPGRNARYAMSEREGTILWLDAWDILQGDASTPPEDEPEADGLFP